MEYSNILVGTFLSRPNRFIAICVVDGKEEKVHVKNTGRCKELLIPGVKVYLQENNNPNRKTKFSLIAVEKGNLLVNMDSQAPNKVLYEALNKGLSLKGLNEDITLIKPEAPYGNSRLDFYVETKEHKAFIEVKGVTLEHDGIAKFPDAPTLRGVRHIRELIKAKEEGYLAYIVFIIQMKGMRYLIPNDETHEEFGQALREASRLGVNILAYDCVVEPNSLTLDKPIKVNL